MKAMAALPYLSILMPHADIVARSCPPGHWQTKAKELPEKIYASPYSGLLLVFPNSSARENNYDNRIFRVNRARSTRHYNHHITIIKGLHMAKNGDEEILSTLYVDFDNIYTRFLETAPDAAQIFATAPHKWLHWLETHALRILYPEGARRRIIKRVCYLNPLRFHEYRAAFMRNAFQVIDCPPLTTRGKTSADIQLVMNCMDDLNHATRFDEFFIFSGDADFTPLLIRLQEHARRTLVLAVGPASPVYTGSASWRIREDWFLQQALRENRPEEVAI